MFMVAAVASAQDVRFDGQLFRPSATARDTLWVEDTAVAPDGYGSARAFLQGAVAPVRWTGADGETDRLVSGLVGTDLLGAWWWNGLRLGAHLPVYAWSGGDLAADQPGLGDLSLQLGGRLLDRERAPLGVAVLGRLMLPTASVEVPLGSTATGWELTGVADRRLDRWLLAANLGTRGVPRATFEDLVWDDQVFGRLGLGWSFREGAGASLELGAQTNWASGRNPAGTAAELLGGGWGRVGEDLVLRGGVSVGLSRSPGAPISRLVLGLGWEPDLHPDRDLDGVADRADWCPADPEDPDGFEDADGCLDASSVVVLALRAPDGTPLAGTWALEGPDPLTAAGLDPMVTLHPGVRRATVSAEGYQAWSGELSITGSGSARLEVTLAPSVGTLRLWAVDALGAEIPAWLEVGGGDPVPADGEPLALPVGEHGLVIRAEGFEARALSVEIGPGEAREVPVVLERATQSTAGSPARRDRPDERLGSR